METVILMKSIRGTVECEWVIRQSRFLGILTPVLTVDEASRFLRQCRERHPQATHVCHALLLSSREIAERASDDGEPQRTAGFPMLDLLKKREYTDCLAVAIRYFGGVKLGAGGLIRAYSETVRLCLQKAEPVEAQTYAEARIVVPYSEYGALEPYLRQECQKIETRFDARAEIRFVCSEIAVPEITAEIRKRTSSDLEVEIVRRWIDYPRSK
jgi:uncharacterized YigZ family protein